jgi:predicted PurR-regulated permease PerM
MKPLPARVFAERAFGSDSELKVFARLGIFLAICAILYFGQSILIPIVLAVLLTLLLAPAVRFLQTVGVPKMIAVTAVVIVSFAFLFMLAAVVGNTVANLAADLPRYESNLRQKAQSLKLATSGSYTLRRAANVLHDLQSELESQKPAGAAEEVAVRPIPVEVRDTKFGPFDPVVSVVGLLIHPLTQLGIVILMVTFILFNREDLRNRLIRLAGTGDIHRTTSALDDAGERLSRLFLTQLLVNALTGAFIGLCLALIGVPGAILWGILTAFLRFVPYVGTLLSSIFPILIAIAIGDGWTLAIITAAIVIATEVTVGQVLEPLFFGKMTGLSPVAIVSSAAFWAALWGPVGLLLSTPLTIVLLVLGRNVEPLGFFEILLGSEPVLTPDHSLYQRLLAEDPIEAADQAHEYEKEEKLDSFVVEVAVPALLLAHRDHLRGVLDKARETAIAHTFSQMLDEVWPEEPEGNENEGEVLLIAAQGPLNFAATLAFSAYLRAKRITHVMLPQDAIAPGKLPPIDTSITRFLCLCYLSAPTEAQHRYVLRRLESKLPAQSIISVAWEASADRAKLQTPVNAATLLPGQKTAPANRLQNDVATSEDEATQQPVAA